MPDQDDGTARLCLAAAQDSARAAGVIERTDNAQYRLFICALASYWFENRGLMTIGAPSTETQHMINSFVLQLR